jgi:hypothetical protein
MRRRFWLHVLKVIVFVTLAVVVIGTAIMLLWNWLLPDLFGWQTISFLQAIGLLVLTRILLGGLRGRWGHGGGHWRARMAARWENMSEEERARFRAGMRHRCGSGRGEPAEQQV